MSAPRDPKSKGPAAEQSNPASPPTDAANDGRSGRIAYDERGNSVWEWQLETGVYSRDINTQKLKKLELDDLSIAETATHARPAGLGAPSVMPGGGFNPYDNSSTTRGNVGGSAHSGGGKAALKSEPREPRKPMDLKKLEEWLEIRKRVQQQQRDDNDD